MNVAVLPVKYEPYLLHTEQQQSYSDFNTVKISYMCEKCETIDKKTEGIQFV